MVDPTLLIMVVVALLTLETDITCGNYCAGIQYPVLKVCEMGTSNTGYQVGLDFSLLENSTSSDCWCYIQQHNQGSIYISTLEYPGTVGCGIIINITQQEKPEQTFDCRGGSHTPNSSKPGDVTSIHSQRLDQPAYNIKYCLRAFDSASSDQISVTCCAAGETDCYTPITTVTEAPTTKPKTEAPTTKPITEAPTTKPKTEAPTTKPTTEAPTTKTTTEAPTTKTTTNAPTTKPITEPPVTKPITEPPVTKPITEAPTTMDTAGIDIKPPPQSSPTIKVEIVAPVIGGAVVLCIVIVVVIIVCLKKRGRKKNKSSRNISRYYENVANDTTEDMIQNHFTAEETGDVYAQVQKGKKNTISTKTDNKPLPDSKFQHSMSDNITVPSSLDSGDVYAQVDKHKKPASTNQLKAQISEKPLIKKKPAIAKQLESEDIELETDIPLYSIVNKAPKPKPNHCEGLIYSELEVCETNDDNKGQNTNLTNSDTEKTIYSEVKLTEL